MSEKEWEDWCVIPYYLFLALGLECSATDRGNADSDDEFEHVHKSMI